MSRSGFNKKYYFKRKSLRLPGYDYFKYGQYFVTIECEHMECRLGKIVKGKMILNDIGEIALEEWLKLPMRFKNFQLDLFQIMPNHMHAIVTLTDQQGLNIEMMNYYSELAYACHYLEVDEIRSLLRFEEMVEKLSSTEAGASPASLSDIIGSYKSIVANECLKIHKLKYDQEARVPLLGKIWKRGFWDNTINDQQSYKAISRYIRNNPKDWIYDRSFKKP